MGVKNERILIDNFIIEALYVSYPIMLLIDIGNKFI